MARQIIEGQEEGSRRRGRPVTRWIGNLKEWSKTTLVEVPMQAGSRAE